MTRQRFVWIWVGLLLVLIGGCGVSHRVNPPATPAPVIQVAPTVLPSAPSPLPSPPVVEPAQLWQHIQALSFERSTPSDRARTRQYLSQTLQKFGWQPELQTFEGGVNVVAQRPGTNRQAGVVLVTAHYDTVPGSVGADDNASAIAAVLEIARLMGTRTTQRTLKLAFFDQEETGLLGSFAYLANPANQQNLIGVINLEMVGYACHRIGCQQYPNGIPSELRRDRGDFLAVIGDQEHAFLLEAFSSSKQANLPPVQTLAVPYKGVMMPDLLRSDHAPFWYQNIGAVMVTDTSNFRNPNYHQASDTAATLDRPFLAGATQQVFNAVNRLVNLI